MYATSSTIGLVSKSDSRQRLMGLFVGPGVDTGAGAQDCQQRLLQSIVHLDGQREAGMIAEVEYHQRRHTEKHRLLALEQQLQREHGQES